MRTAAPASQVSLSKSLSEQVADIGSGQLGGGEVTTVEYAAEQFGLSGFEGHDFLFDGVFCDEPVDHDGAGLSYAVYPVHGLGFGGRVPPGVKQDAVVSLGEVEAEPTGFEADQEHRRCAVLERTDRVSPVAGRPIEIATLDTS